MAQFKYEVWSVPGIATFEKKIAELRPDSASGTLYRRQSGRGQLTIPANYDRLDEIITVDPANHANDVASLIRVFRGSDLIQELLVPVSPNLVADQPADLSCEGVEAVLDWAVVECWDWDGTADFVSTVPDWIYGGRNLIPDLTLGDLGSIREEWDVYLSGERYTLDLSAATSGTFTITAEGDTTAAIAFDASRGTIKSALEALASITTVSVVQADPNVNTFTVVFENPKDLSVDSTASFGSLGGTGTYTKLNDGFDTSLNPTFTLTVDGQTTSALAWNATAKQVEGSPLGAQPGLEGLSNVNDVTVSGTGIASDPWSITFYDPPDPTNFTATFAAGTAVLTKITEGDVDPSPITLSQSIDASRNPTIHGCYDEPPIQVVTTPLDTGAEWSLLVNATCQFAGSQIVLNGVTPGQIYQASINVRPTVDGLYTLVIRDEFENPIKTTTPRDNLLTAGSFQTLTIADVEIPEGVNRVIFRVAVTDPTSANIADFYVNWQGAQFREGQAATTAGQIILDLLADAQTDHAAGGFPRTTLDFINASFDAAIDSASVVWADPELSVNIPRGMTYRKVLDRVFGQLGYEWNLTPTSGTPGEWDLNVWNPDGRGTDHSAADTPSLLLGQGTLGGSATRQIPRANRIISEGAQQYTTRARNTASEGTIGSREWYQADVSYFDTQAEDWTDKTLARFLDVSLQPRFEIADPPSSEWPVPVVDYGLADTLNVDLADGAGKVSRTVEAISWRTVADGIRWGVHTGEAQFDAFPTGSGLPLGTSGGTGSRGSVAVAPQRGNVALSGPVDEGVRRLLDQFDRQVRIPEASAFVPGRGGGAPTVVVAASNSTDYSKGKADFLCGGSDDQVVIQEAIDAMDSDGRLLLTEGTFHVSASGGHAIDARRGVAIQGLGVGQTAIQCGTTSALSDYVVRIGPNGSLVGVHVTTGTNMRGVQMLTEDCILDWCQITMNSAAPSYAVVTAGFGDRFWITRTDINAVGPGIFCDGGDFVWIIQTRVGAGGVAIEADSTIDHLQIKNCDIGASDSAVVADGVDFLQVEGNQIVAGEHGIHLANVVDATVIGNIIEASVGTPDTFDGIHLSGTSSRNSVKRNKMIRVPGTRYGINVADANCDCNIIVDNDLGDPADYGADAINDAGTNTQWKYPDDPVYGDNFTICEPTPS